MKIWLILVFLAIAAATSARQNRTQKKPPRWQKPCIGCFTALGKPVPALVEPGPLTIQREEPSKEPPLPGGRISNIGEAALSLRDPSKLVHLQRNAWNADGTAAEGPNARRTKREEKRSGLVRRRGKQRSSSRPVCRGCYSGLMIVAPPVHSSNNSFIPVLESHSELGWDSSEEEYLSGVP